MHKAPFSCLQWSHIVKILSVGLSHTLTLKSLGTTLDGDSGKGIRFFKMLNIAAGLLNKEKRGWIPGGQVLYVHWKATLISSEYMIMERKMVLNMQNVQDISVDHGKMLHNQCWWGEKVSSSSFENTFLKFQKLVIFFKDLGWILFLNLRPFVKRKHCCLNFATYIYWPIVGRAVTRRNNWGTMPENSGQEKICFKSLV